MADFGSPIAQGVNGPAQALPMLSNIMNIKLQQQALQTGQYVQEQQQAGAQSQQQQMNERQLLQSSLQSGKDPDGNPLKDPNTGEISAPALTAFASKYMPLTGQQVTQNIIKTQSDLLGLHSTALGLDATQRQMLAGPIQDITVNPSDDGIANAKSAIANLVSNHPEMAKNAVFANSLLGQIQQQQDPKQRASMATKMSGLLQGGQAVQTQPMAGTIDTGTEIKPGVVTPPAAGGGFTPAGTPIKKGMIGINPATGQPFSVTPGTGHAPAPAPTASAWPRLPQFPTPQQAQSATAAAQEADTVRQADSNPVMGYAPTKQVYGNLLNLIKENPAIGPQSGAWNQLTSVLTPFGASPNSSMQEVSSYLDRLALQNAGAAGLSTDAARSMAAGAAGTTEMNPEALKEKLRFGAATLEASHAYRQGLDNVVGPGNQNPIAKRTFDAAWSQNADINAFRLLAAKGNNDTEGYNKTLAQINKLPPNQRTQVQLHMHNLNMLVNGQMPQ